MTKVKLTKRKVDEAEVRPARYTVFDSEIRGFGLRIFPSGQKSWIFEYKVEGGRKAATRRVTIGKTTDFSPDEARKIADTLRAQAKVGQDPQKAKSDSRQASTVKEVADAFLREHVKQKRRTATMRNYSQILTNIVVPALGNRKAGAVSRSDIARLHLELSSKPFQANRAVAVIGSMYSFAGKVGLVPEGINPARGVEKYREEGRERFLSGDELVRLGAAIREAETVGAPWEINPDGKTKHLPKTDRQTPIGIHAAAALRLLIFTGARLREILHLQWTSVDFERGMLHIPKSKTGKKSIVLNAPALAVLTDLPRVGRM